MTTSMPPTFSTRRRGRCYGQVAALRGTHPDIDKLVDALVDFSSFRGPGRRGTELADWTVYEARRHRTEAWAENHPDVDVSRVLQLCEPESGMGRRPSRPRQVPWLESWRPVLDSAQVPARDAGGRRVDGGAPVAFPPAAQQFMAALGNDPKRAVVADLGGRPDPEALGVYAGVRALAGVGPGAAAVAPLVAQYLSAVALARVSTWWTGRSAQGRGSPAGGVTVPSASRPPYRPRGPRRTHQRRRVRIRAGGCSADPMQSAAGAEEGNIPGAVAPRMCRAPAGEIPSDRAVDTTGAMASPQSARPPVLPDETGQPVARPG